MQVRVNDGDWKVVKATIEAHPQRFTLRCNIDGVFGNFSAVISLESVSIFNEVSFG